MRDAHERITAIAHPMDASTSWAVTFKTTGSGRAVSVRCSPLALRGVQRPSLLWTIAGTTEARGHLHARSGLVTHEVICYRGLSAYHRRRRDTRCLAVTAAVRVRSLGRRRRVLTVSHRCLGSRVHCSGRGRAQRGDGGAIIPRFVAEVPPAALWGVVEDGAGT